MCINKQNQVLMLFLFLYTINIDVSADCPQPELISPCYCIGDGHFRCHGDTPYGIKTIFKSLSDHLNSSDKHYNEIHIENTAITELVGDLFGDITFNRIYIEDTKCLRRISTEAFRNQTRASRLVIQYTPVENVPPFYDIFKALSYLTNLEAVTLLNTAITHLPSDAFSVNVTLEEPFRKLVYIDIRQSLETIGDYAFTNLDNVMEINLQHNGIDYIGEHAFTMETNSDRKLDIELSNNTLNASSFAFFAFSNVNRPYRLWLRNNLKLTSLSEIIFGPVLSNENELRLLNVPLVCDCKLSWIYKLRTRYSGLISNAMCAIDGSDLFDSNHINLTKCA